MEMIALSIKQPWANLIADGKKRIEVRSWRTRPQRDIVLCSSRIPRIDPAGFAICLCDIIDCQPMEPGDQRFALVPWRPGAFAWTLNNIRRIPLFPIIGRLSFFSIDIPRDLTHTIKPLLHRFPSPGRNIRIPRRAALALEESDRSL